ncbi:MAG: AraC family transcriptional regulator [Adhaeribacter sp.]
MKPQLLKVSPGLAHSFSVRQDNVPNVNNSWHFHVEIELVHFHKGSGTQFVGDNIKRFNAGDIVLVGSNLPHYWRYDDLYFQENTSETAYATVVHFCENFWGDKFLYLPENMPLKIILDKAKRGILIPVTAAQKVGGLIQKILLSEGPLRIIALIECLLTIAATEELITLSSIGFQGDLSELESERINTIYDFTFKNFKDKIYLEEVAAVAGLTPNSFCRYFKTKTGKTFSQFLLEIRVGYACKLLIENKFSIKHLCFESGFNNFTCFHKNFKQITGNTPQDYRNQYKRGC